MAKQSEKKTPLRSKEKAILQAEKEKMQRKTLVKRLLHAILVLGILALAAYLTIPAYQYSKATSLATSGQYSEASQIFGSLGQYRDSVDQIDRISIRALADSVRFQSVYFGRYEQDNNPNNGTEPLKWRILKTEEDRMFLVTDMIIDEKHYHDEPEAITWERSSLRAWLNDNFLNNAFLPDHRSMIEQVKIPNGEKPINGVNGGNDTIDRVFLLDIEEAGKYFNRNESRVARETGFAQAQNKQVETWYQNFWWLRSTGVEKNTVSIVNDSGEIISDGFRVRTYSGVPVGVRSAIWVRFGRLYLPLQALIPWISTKGKTKMSKLDETIALAKSQNMIDDRNALFFANAKKLPNGEFGLCLVCINGNTMGIYDTDFSQNIGKQMYKIELNGISNIKRSSFVFNRYVKFEYAGNQYHLADFGDAKRLIEVVMAESNRK